MRRCMAAVARVRGDPPVARGGGISVDRCCQKTEDKPMKTNTCHTTHDSPVGPLLLAANEDGLCLIEFFESRHRVKRDDDWREGDHEILRETRRQLDEYFRRERRQFDLPLAPRGTAFQREVWQMVATIPYGATISYAQLAT